MTAADADTGPRADADVIIVGAGPSGLVAAIRLIQLGLTIRIVDTATAPVPESRAALMHAATVEILADIGIGRDLFDQSVRITAVSLADGNRQLARIPFSHLDTPYPFALGIPQSTTEALLIARLEQLDHHVERGVRIEHIVRRAHDCTVSGRSLGGGPGGHETPWEATATFVVGADGKNSTVRDQAGIPFEGAPYDEDFILADVELVPAPAAADEARITLSPRGVTVLGLLPSERYRIVATASPDVETPHAPDRGYLDALLDARGIPTRTAAAPAWSSRFRIGHRRARRLRTGNILLCGDAAHVHSPAAGQGMNTGIADAYDLAGSIAAARAGSRTALADYDRRRRRAARQTVNLTDRITRVALLRARPARLLRNTAIRALTRITPLRDALARSVSGLDRSPLRRGRTASRE